MPRSRKLRRRCHYIRAKNIDITTVKRTRDNIYQAWIIDPNSVKVELFEYTDKSTQFIGDVSIVDE